MSDERIEPNGSDLPLGRDEVKHLHDRLDTLVIMVSDVKRTANDALTLGHELVEGQGRLLAEIGRLKKEVGTWPTSPDDTGSGLAGRLAREQSSPVIVIPPAPAEGPSLSVPPQWKRWRNVAVGVVAVLTAAATVAASIAEALK